MTKQALRKTYNERRLLLSNFEVTTQSKAIAQHFFEVFEVEKVKAIHCYLPIKKKHEVDTFPIIYTIQDRLSQTHLVVPKVIPDTNDLIHYQWLSNIKLEINQWGILEPTASNIEYQISNIGLVIVPLLAFDKHGNRVGYGKGFYDKFLSHCKPTTLKVGLSFFEPVDAITDINEFDIKLDCCITPNKVWRFKH